jgi:hypothetical protein
VPDVTQYLLGLTLDHLCCHREHELDAKLRALKTSELPATLQPEQLQALLQEASQSGIGVYVCAAS